VMVGGFICADAPNAGTLDAAIALLGNTLRNTQHSSGIQSWPALSRFKGGSTITKSRKYFEALSYLRRDLIQNRSPHLGRKAKFLRIGNRCCMMPSWLDRSDCGRQFLDRIPEAIAGADDPSRALSSYLKSQRNCLFS
jgi:hypothetical protein